MTERKPVTPSFALQSVQERRTLIDEVAVRLNVASLIVEKDFWVGWLLGRLFAMPSLTGQIQFKGGNITVYGVWCRAAFF